MALRLGGLPRDVSAYASAFYREFAGEWKPSTSADLQKCLLQSRIVLGADFHAYSQSQRMHLRILREWPTDRPVILALECFESRQQKELEAYMAGKLSAEAFLKRIAWHERWGFPWENYLPLIELARKRSFRVFGINRHFPKRTKATLLKRDRHAAQQLVELARKFPDHLIYVIFGELHLARTHLPQLIRRQARDARLEITVIFQDSDQLYFRLARKNLETKVEVLRGSRRRFCLLGSPPWVRWQSYLMYLEQTYDADLEGEEDDVESVDYTDHVHSLIQFASRDLGVRIKADDLAVYTAGEQSSHRQLFKPLSSSEQKIAVYHVRNDLSFFVPSTGVFYLSRLTINHAATLAGIYLQSKLSRRKRLLWSLPEDFLALIWTEALGFFVSKLINHKRKAETLQDINKQLNVISPHDRGREALLLVLDQRMSELVELHGRGRQRQSRFSPRQKQSYLAASRILGQMLGERMYLAYRAHRLDARTMVGYLKKDVDSADFPEFYMKVVKRLEFQDASRSPVLEQQL